MSSATDEIFHIEVKGLASGRTMTFGISPSDIAGKDKSLMKFLQDKGIPIASSCGGEGVCKKCTLQQVIAPNKTVEIVSCTITLKTLKQQLSKTQRKVLLEISYF